MVAENKSLRNTKQRQHLLELLSSTQSHPNAFWLYEKMLPKFPNLSLSTVYRNLGILEAQGLIQKLSCGGTFDRYDADISMHSHFYCKRCGHVYDIDVKAVEQSALCNAESGGHSFDGCQITFFGTCEQCRSAHNH